MFFLSPNPSHGKKKKQKSNSRHNKRLVKELMHKDKNKLNPNKEEKGNNKNKSGKKRSKRKSMKQ